MVMAAAPPSLLLLSILLLSSPLSHAFFFSNYVSLFSLSHSLVSRVANLRAARGDLSGAARARTLARTLEHCTSLGLYKFAWNVGWDFIKNYSWRDKLSFQTLGGVVSDLSELARALLELSRMQSNAERMVWVDRNYRNALRVSSSILTRLLTAFRQPGPLREIVLALQKEVSEGELLRDCLEMGSDDLKGLVQVLKNMGLYSSASTKTDL